MAEKGRKGLGQDEMEETLQKRNTQGEDGGK